MLAQPFTGVGAHLKPIHCKADDVSSHRHQVLCTVRRSVQGLDVQGMGLLGDSRTLANGMHWPKAFPPLKWSKA